VLANCWRKIWPFWHYLALNSAAFGLKQSMWAERERPIFRSSLKPTCDTRSPLRYPPAPAPLPLTGFSARSAHAPLQSHALNILFICIHRRPKHNSRKKTEQHNVTKLKKEQQSKLLVKWAYASTLCLKKRAQLWNGIARNYMDRFWWYLAEIFKSL